MIRKTIKTVSEFTAMYAQEAKVHTGHFRYLKFQGTNQFTLRYK